MSTQLWAGSDYGEGPQIARGIAPPIGLRLVGGGADVEPQVTGLVVPVVTSGALPLLVVAIAWRSAAVQESVAAIDFNGVPIAPASSGVSAVRLGAFVGYLAAPPIAAGVVTVTMTGLVNIGMVCLPYDGARQDASVLQAPAPVAVAHGVGTTPTMPPFVSAPGQVCVDALAAGGGNSGVPNAGQFERLDAAIVGGGAAANVAALVSTRPGIAPTVATMGWTTTLAAAGTQAAASFVPA